MVVLLLPIFPILSLLFSLLLLLLGIGVISSLLDDAAAVASACSLTVDVAVVVEMLLLLMPAFDFVLAAKNRWEKRSVMKKQMKRRPRGVKTRKKGEEEMEPYL
jgi:hypothetical protein